MSQDAKQSYPVEVLLAGASRGDQRAWDQLVELFAPLIWSICCRYQLRRPAADDVGQAVWLRLVDQLALRPDPAGLVSWIAATTRQECSRVLRATAGPYAPGPGLRAADRPVPGTGGLEPGVLRAERHNALRVAFAELPPECQQLIALLIQQPAGPAAQAGARLGIPPGCADHHRRRCLDKLRGHPAIAALVS
jgi:RNA polymerase sigma factor (sigma-70 family)